VGEKLQRERLGSGLRRIVVVWIAIAAIVTVGAGSAWALWSSSAASTQEPTTGALVTPTLTLATEGTSVTSLYGEISTVACPSSTLCFAGAGHDSYLGTPSGYSPLLEWQGTTWSATTAPEYMGAINLISCASVSACLAVGEGDLASPGAVVDVPSWSWWNGTSWSAAVATPLPASDQAWWRGASCVATSSGSLCWIVGTNVEKAGTAPPGGGYGFEITDTTGSAPTAGSVEAIGPSPADWAELTGVSCPTSTTCYTSGDIGTTEVGVWAWDGSSWNSTPVSTISDPIPTGQPSTTRMMAAEGISCAATDLCEAVGSEMYLPTGSTDMTSSAFADVLDGTTWDAHILLETSGIAQNLGLSSACSGNTTYPMCWMGGSGDSYDQFATLEPFTSSGFGMPNFVGLSGVKYGDSLNGAGSGPEGAWRTDQIDYVIAVACAPPASSSATSTTCWAGGKAKSPTSNLSNTDAPDAGFLDEWNGSITSSNGGWPFVEATWTPDSAIQSYGSQVYYAQNVPTGSTTSTCIQVGVSNLAYLGGGEVTSSVQTATSFAFPPAVMGDECVLVGSVINSWGSPPVPTVAAPSATIVG